MVEIKDIRTGKIRRVPEVHAVILLKTRRYVEVESVSPAAESPPAVESPEVLPDAAPVVRPKRQYRRRDMKSE